MRRNKPLRDLKKLKDHLGVTLDEHLDDEDDGASTVAHSAFLRRYYVRCPLSDLIQPYLDSPDTRPVLLLGRAGTGKTTVLTAILSNCERPYLRVPFIKGTDVRTAGKEGVERLLDEEVRKAGNLRLRNTFGRKLIKVLWLEFFDAVVSGDVTLQRANSADRILIDRVESLRIARNEGQPQAEILKLSSAVQAAISAVTETGALNTYLQMLCFHLSSGRQREINLFIDNIENTEHVHLVRMLLEALTSIKSDLTSVRIVLSMRDSTLVAVEPDAEEDVIQSEIGEGREDRRLNLATTMYEVFYLGGSDFSEQDYLRHASKVLARRVARYLGASIGDAEVTMADFERVSTEEGDILKECFHLIFDERSSQAMARLTNYNLRDIFTMLMNVAESRVNARQGKQKLPGFVLTNQSASATGNREDQGVEDLTRLPDDDFLSGIYYLCGSRGIEGSVNRAPKNFHDQLSRGVFDPLCLVFEDVRRERYSLVHAKQEFKDKHGSVSWGDRYDVLRARIVFCACARELPLTGLSSIGSKAYSMKNVQRSCEKFGISPHFVRLVIASLSGRGSSTNLLDLEMEEIQSFTMAPPTSLISLQPRGSTMYVGVPHRYHYWAGAEEHAGFSWYNRIVKQVDEKGEAVTTIPLLALLSLSHLIGLAKLEVSYLVAHAPHKSPDELGYWTTIFDFLVEYSDILCPLRDRMDKRAVLLSHRSVRNIHQYFDNSRDVHRVNSRSNLIHVADEVSGAINSLLIAVAAKAGSREKDLNLKSSKSRKEELTGHTFEQIVRQLTLRLDGLDKDILSLRDRLLPPGGAVAQSLRYR